MFVLECSLITEPVLTRVVRKVCGQMVYNVMLTTILIKSNTTPNNVSKYKRLFLKKPSTCIVRTQNKSANFKINETKYWHQMMSTF